MSAVVLTSENSAEFYAAKLNPAPEPAAAPNPAADATKVAEVVEKKPEAVESAEVKPANDAEKEAAEQQVEADHPDPEKKQKLNLRFSELSQRAKEAEAKAQAAEAARELAERTAAELKAKYEPPKTDELGPKPTRAQFSTDEDFSQAIEEWAGEKAIRDRDYQEAESKRVSAWSERQAAARKELPDYDTVIAQSGNLMVSNEVREAILKSEVGPKILHHLAKNPDVVAALKREDSVGALLIIGGLQADFLKGKTATGEAKADPPKPAAAATEISRAPAPITPIRSTGSAVETASIDSSGVFHGSYADWKAQRKAGRIK